jgi:hypothetical protein
MPTIAVRGTDRADWNHPKRNKRKKQIVRGPVPLGRQIPSSCTGSSREKTRGRRYRPGDTTNSSRRFRAIRLAVPSLGLVGLQEQ